MEVSGQLHAPAALPPGEETLVPIGQKAWTGRGGEEKFTIPAETRTTEHPARNPAL
jgi:hypothetical protein